MKIRIFLKSFKLAWRTGKRFVIFVAVYMFLIIFTSYMLIQLWGPSIQAIENPFERLGNQIVFDMEFFTPKGPLIIGFTLIVVGTIIVATFYGFIVSGYRKREVATLRTIGWDAGSIRTLFLGELLLVYLVAFLMVIEIVFHILGVSHYFLKTTDVPGLRGIIIPGEVLATTFLMILGCQVFGTFVGYRRMLRVSPMDAMRKAV